MEKIYLDNLAALINKLVEEKILPFKIAKAIAQSQQNNQYILADERGYPLPFLVQLISKKKHMKIDSEKTEYHGELKFYLIINKDKKVKKAMQNKISEKMRTSLIEKGIDKGFVHLIQNDETCDDVACKIGDYWFYFMDSNCSIEEVQKSLTKKELAEKITEAVNDNDSIDENERLYYIYYLKEKLS